PVSSTVRIGTLMPTPRVSVPQMIFSSPDWASFSTRRRYFGSIPAWCTPMPSRTRRERICPKPFEKRKSPMISRIRSFSSGPRIFCPCSAWACSSASFWVKCTMYTGASRSSRIALIVSGSGSRDQRKSSGTGRGASSMTLTCRPVRSVRSSTKRVTSPSVALISTNWQRGSYQRHLPGPAALGVAVVVELVHHRQAHVAAGPVAQRVVGEDLGGAHDDRGVVVDSRVTGHHPHVLGPELCDEVEELLAHQGLDGGGVVRALAAGHGGEDRGVRDRRLPRSGGGGRDDVIARGDRQQRLLL